MCVCMCVCVCECVCVCVRVCECASVCSVCSVGVGVREELHLRIVCISCFTNCTVATHVCTQMKRKPYQKPHVHNNGVTHSRPLVGGSATRTFSPHVYVCVCCGQSHSVAFIISSFVQTKSEYDMDDVDVPVFLHVKFLPLHSTDIRLLCMLHVINYMQ